MMTKAAVRPTEEQCEDTIVEAAKTFGYLVHVERKARTNDGWRTPIKGHAGWPDMALVHPERQVMIFAELKRKPRKPTEEQLVWLDGIQRCGVISRLVWVPEDMYKFITELREKAGR